MPGAWKKVGNVVVAVNTADTRADPSGLDGFWPAATPSPATTANVDGSSSETEIPDQVATGSLILCLDNGKEKTLKIGVTIFGSDLGEAGNGSAQAVAQVQGHPAKNDTLGLVNLSTTAWTVTNSQGDRITIPRGMTITLKDGLTIFFGSKTGVVRLRT